MNEIIVISLNLICLWSLFDLIAATDKKNSNNNNDYNTRRAALEVVQGNVLLWLWIFYLLKPNSTETAAPLLVRFRISSSSSSLPRAFCNALNRNLSTCDYCSPPLSVLFCFFFSGRHRSSAPKKLIQRLFRSSVIHQGVCAV